MVLKRITPISRLFLSLLIGVILTSCATLNTRSGVWRIKKYEISSANLPGEFEGLSAVFISDTHYPSKFTRKRLKSVVETIRRLSPDVLFLGGDYLTTIDAGEEFFAALSAIKTTYGTFAVLGNHDTAIRDTLSMLMQKHGIILLSNSTDTIVKGSDSIFICGVDYESVPKTPITPFATRKNSDFLILLSHSPDYAADYDISKTDILLSGHTHGGQVTLFGLIVPETNSRYGRRFLTGLNFNNQGIPVITTNGLGTSRRKIRFCAPSEIVYLKFKKE